MGLGATGGNDSPQGGRLGNLSIHLRALALIVIAGVLFLTPIFSGDSSPASAATPRLNLQSAPVPAGMCGHPAGRLVNGQRDFGQWGSDQLELIARGEIHGGAIAIASISCSAGGVGWPDTLVFYSQNRRGKPRLVGKFKMSRLRSSEHVNAQQLSISDGWASFQASSSEGCCSEMQTITGRLRLSDGHPVLAGVNYVWTP
jgi:hypothetical protein